MLEGVPILNTLGGVLLFLAKLFLLVSCCLVVYRNKNGGSILMLLGAMTILVADILGIGLLFYASKSGPSEVIRFNGINSIVSAISYLLFTIGFLIYNITDSKR